MLAFRLILASLLAFSAEAQSDAVQTASVTTYATTMVTVTKPAIEETGSDLVLTFDTVCKNRYTVCMEVCQS